NNSHPTLCTLLYDSWRFILRNHSTIRTAPLQTYSALIFSPQNSILRKSHNLPSWLSPTDSINADWDPALLSIQAHRRHISSTAFSPDGKWIASASYDQTVKVWNANTGTLYRTLEGPDFLMGEVLAFSPDNKLLVSDGSKGNVHLWDVTVPNSERTYESHSDHVFHLASSANCELVASASKDKTVRLWDPVTKRTRHVLRADDMKAVWIVEFSPDGKSLATGSEDSTVRLWDTATGNLIRTFDGHSRGLWALAFSDDGSRLVSGSIDSTVVVWNVATG
ncbi:hypothetical protein ASPWEDRAFT_95752, partial [Aspergillus wentii DTO 134E9]